MARLRPHAVQLPSQLRSARPRAARSTGRAYACESIAAATSRGDNAVARLRESRIQLATEGRMRATDPRARTGTRATSAVRARLRMRFQDRRYVPGRPT